MRETGPLFGFIPPEYAGFALFAVIIAGVVALLLWMEKTGRIELLRQPGGFKHDEQPMTQYNPRTGLPEATPGSAVDVRGNTFGRDDY